MLSMANDRRLWLVLPMATLLLLGTGCQQTQQRKDPKPAPTTRSTTSTPRPADPTPAPDPRVMLGNSSSVFLPTGDRATSSLHLERSSPGEVRMGQEYEYTLTVTNLTSMPLNNVQVTETTEGGFSLTGSAPQGRLSGNQAVWDLGTLGPRESKTIRVRGRATAKGNIESCASVTWDTAACVTTRVVEPKLKLDKTAPAEVLACDDIPLTFTVTNTGDGSVRSVVVEDELPSGMTVNGQSTIRLDAGTLAAGQSRTLNAVAKASRPGTYENTATATSEGDLTTRSNSTSTVVRQPVLELSLNCPDKIWVGRNAVYEITVRNTGDGVARDARIDCTTSGAPVQFVSASDGGSMAGGKVTWNLGTLAAGATKTVTVTLRGTDKGTINVSSTANAYCATAVTEACTTAVEGIPAVLLEVIDEVDPVQVGTNTTYVITVTNQGSAQDTNVAIECELEDASELVSASGATAPATAVSASVRTLTFAPLGVLGVGQEAVWRVVVKAKTEGDTRFTVRMNTANLSRPVQENEATNHYN